MNNELSKLNISLREDIIENTTYIDLNLKNQNISSIEIGSLIDNLIKRRFNYLSLEKLYLQIVNTCYVAINSSDDESNTYYYHDGCKNRNDYDILFNEDLHTAKITAIAKIIGNELPHDEAEKMLNEISSKNYNKLFKDYKIII